MRGQGQTFIIRASDCRAIRLQYSILMYVDMQIVETGVLKISFYEYTFNLYMVKPTCLELRHFQAGRFMGPTGYLALPSECGLWKYQVPLRLLLPV